MKTNKLCPICNEEYIGAANKLYCSQLCKSRAHQKRHENAEESASVSSKIDLTRSKNVNNKNTRTNIGSSSIALEKYKLSLNHQRKLLAFEEQQKRLALQEKQLKLIAKRKKEEQAALEAKQAQEAKEKKQQEEIKKSLAPIKIATHDIVSEIINDGRDTVWSTSDIFETIEDISSTIEMLIGYYQTLSPYKDYRKSPIYIVLNELEQELTEILKDKSFYVNKLEVLVDFKKSYIRSLKLFLQDLDDFYPA